MVRPVSSDVVVVRGVRALVGLSVRLMTSVDAAAERVEDAQLRARELLSRLPVPRGPEEL